MHLVQYTFFNLARCIQEDRIQFNKAVIDLIESDYGHAKGNVPSRGRAMTIADKRKAKINWKFDQMDYDG